jgi:hypothetical protein
LSEQIISFVKECFESGDLAEKDWHINFPNTFGEMRSSHLKQIRELIELPTVLVLHRIIQTLFFPLPKASSLFATRKKKD